MDVRIEISHILQIKIEAYRNKAQATSPKTKQEKKTDSSSNRYIIITTEDQEAQEVN